MGMYTGLRLKVILRPEFIPVVRRLYQINDNPPWEVLAQEYPQYPFLAKWSAVDRCNFIPFGALSYMPKEWDEEASEWNSGLTGDRWHLHCSLKNYEDEIETFLKDVLPHMIEKIIEGEMLYEESVDEHYRPLPTRLTSLSDGKSVIVMGI